MQVNGTPPHGTVDHDPAEIIERGEIMVNEEGHTSAEGRIIYSTKNNIRVESQSSDKGIVFFSSSFQIPALQSPGFRFRNPRRI